MILIALLGITDLHDTDTGLSLRAEPSVMNTDTTAKWYLNFMLYIYRFGFKHLVCVEMMKPFIYFQLKPTQLNVKLCYH